MMKRQQILFAFLTFLLITTQGACNYPALNNIELEEKSVTPILTAITITPKTQPTGEEPGAPGTPEAQEMAQPALSYAESLAVPAEKVPVESSWLAEGQALALMTGDSLLLYQGSGQSKPEMIPANQPVMLATSLAQDQIGWVEQDNSLHLWSNKENKEVWNSSPASQTVTSMAISPNGNELAYSDFASGFYQVNLPLGRVVIGSDHDYWLSDLAYSPDGKELAGVDKENFTVYFYQVGIPEPTRSLKWEESASPVLYGAYFSPDWHTLAWIARGTVQLMDVQSGQLGKTLSHEDFIDGVAWSPSGKSLAVISAFTDGGSLKPGVVIWNTQNGMVITQVTTDSSIRSISFSPGGDRLVLVLESGRVMLWNAANIP